MTTSFPSCPWPKLWETRHLSHSGQPRAPRGSHWTPYPTHFSLSPLPFWLSTDTEAWYTSCILRTCPSRPAQVCWWSEGSSLGPWKAKVHSVQMRWGRGGLSVAAACHMHNRGPRLFGKDFCRTLNWQLSLLRSFFISSPSTECRPSVLASQYPQNKTLLLIPATGI